jgi:hypothetical protein
MAVAKRKTQPARGVMHNWSPAKGAPKGKTKARAKSAGSAPKIAQLSEYRLRGNPGASDITTIGKTGLVGVGGGLTARVFSAIVLGLMDRFGLSGISQNKFASPLGTLVMAWIAVPIAARQAGLSSQSQTVARFGGIMFATMEVLNNVISGVQDNVVNRARSLAAGNAVTTNPQTAADAVRRIADTTQQGALDAGLSPDIAANIAASAAESTLGALGGVPSMDDGEYSFAYLS